VSQHNIIHNHNSAMQTDGILWNMFTFRLNVRNIPQNIVSPAKQCEDYEKCYEYAFMLASIKHALSCNITHYS
jgi:hypothetical protein